MRFGRVVAASSIAAVMALIGPTIAHAAGGGTVPLPDSLVLIVSGVAGMVGVSWWVRRNKK